MMSQPQLLPADLPVAQPLSGRDKDGQTPRPREANPVDSPIVSPVHLLQDKLQQFDETKHSADKLAAEEESAYEYRGSKSPAWVRMTLPVGLSIGLRVAIAYGIGLLG